MVSQKRYMPTNKRFQDHTKMFVGTKTKKGHLGGDKEKDKSLSEGVLVKVIKEKRYEDGWEVRIGKSKDVKTYMCYYGDNIMYLPEYNETDLYYVPKHECKVWVSIDSKTGVRFITKINDPNKKPISMDSNKISIQGNGSSAIEVTTDVVKAVGQLLSDNDVVVKNEETEVSLKEVGEKVDSLETDGLTTKGDIVIEVDMSKLSTEKETTTQTNTETKKTTEVSMTDLYIKIIDLEKRIEKLEQNNG